MRWPAAQPSSALAPAEFQRWWRTGGPACWSNRVTRTSWPVRSSGSSRTVPFAAGWLPRATRECANDSRWSGWWQEQRPSTLAWGAPRIWPTFPPSPREVVRSMVSIHRAQLPRAVPVLKRAVLRAQEVVPLLGMPRADAANVTAVILQHAVAVGTTQVRGRLRRLGGYVAAMRPYFYDRA